MMVSKPFPLNEYLLKLPTVHLLVEYLCSRLKNTDNLHNYRAGIREVNAALQVLAKWDSFPRGDFSVVASAIFSLSEATTFKDQTPTTRQELWVFISHLVRNQETILKRDLGAATVVKGIVSMGLAEKNPGCLEVLFPLYSHISRQWKLEPVEFDSIWDSFIRYFPVQVGNSAKESLASSKEHMRNLLLQCIVSNDYYATKAFERLIEMLDTESDLSANTKVCSQRRMHYT
jgi:DNA repair/transcription protein MET18/MMS19